jgi:hypothetical protein
MPTLTELAREQRQQQERGEPIRQIPLSELARVIAIAAANKGGEVLALPGDFERLLNRGVNQVGGMFGLNPGFGTRVPPAFPSSEEIKPKIMGLIEPYLPAATTQPYGLIRPGTVQQSSQ